MQTNVKLPEGLSGISKLMKMPKEEVQAWDFYEDVRGLFKDYNFGMLTKSSLVGRLTNISEKCADKRIYHYSTGIDKAIDVIRTCY